MTKVLIVYLSRTRHVEKMAQWVAEGAREVPEVEVVVKKVVDATLQDALNADGIIFGTPVYFGTMVSEIKAYIDRFGGHIRELQGKIGGAFTSAYYVDGGISLTLLSIYAAMAIANMIIVPEGWGRISAAGCEEVPALDPLKDSEKVHERCKDLGRRVAQLASILKGKIPTHIRRP